MSWNWLIPATAMLLASALPALGGATVKPYQGRPVIYVDGKPTFPMIYALTEGGRFTWQETPARQIRNFAEAGVHLVQIDCWFRDIWTAPQKLDLDFVDRQIKATIAADPEARIFVRVHVGAPRWWVDAHPEEQNGYAEAGSPQPDRDDTDLCKRHSLASSAWRQESTEMLRLYLRHVKSLPEGKQVVGYHLSDGVYGEWHYWGFFHQPDTGPAMTRYYRQWLTARYKTDAALKKAWNDPKASLATATVPGMKERLQTSHGIFRNAIKERRLLDYSHCQQAIVADDILHFCRVVKEECGPDTITGAFYGYFFNHADQVEGGHLEIERVLASPYIDYFAAPYSYLWEARHVGGTGQLRGIIEAVTGHGKLFLSEQDNPTYLGDAFNRGAEVRPADEAESIATMRRDFCQILTHGVGMWWYDFGPKGDGGWWDAPALMAEAKRMREIGEASLKRPYKSRADVALVVDPKSFYEVAIPKGGQDPVSVAMVNDLAEAATRSGAAYDTILLSDLARRDLSRYKVFVFTNTYRIPQTIQKIIHERILGAGKTAIWVGAPGYLTDKGPSLAAMESLTGMKLREIREPRPVQVMISNGNPLQIPAGEVGLKAEAWPLFAIEDKIAMPLGTLSGGKEVGMAVKRVGKGVSIFCAVPPKDPSVLSALLEQSRAHIYCRVNDAFYIGGNYLGIHTKLGGKRTIELTEPSTVVDAFTGKILARNITKFMVELAPKSTELYELSPAK